MAFQCYLCQTILSSRKQLLSHERTEHKNNKTIPHLHLLIQPSSEQLISYQDAFVILIKKRLGFDRHSIGQKQLLINVFPENVFVHLFQSEPSFHYNSALRNSRHNPVTKTTGYVLLANYEGNYEISFIWVQTELIENNRTFQCGMVTCTFITDAGQFINKNQSQEYFITDGTTNNRGRKKIKTNFEYWSSRHNPVTKTTGYVLLANYEGNYEISFIWVQTELIENNRTFQCGMVTCTFITDAGQFINKNQSQEYFITDGTTNNSNQLQH
ncbi:hypothetical protein Glove_26g203 [Diversispora epigaea]|uniref:C2H2-type domain-containing protein n=1 Tax=Diversispora epigaea TaxID=1348612 RepID=A0A397JIJ3_9GLOM|nr:hypothetical protein Glove_26g203 [Diversispora epigaea]